MLEAAVLRHPVDAWGGQEARTDTQMDRKGTGNRITLSEVSYL